MRRCAGIVACSPFVESSPTNKSSERFMFRSLSHTQTYRYSLSPATIAMIGIAVAAFALYGPFLRNPLVFDDVNVLHGLPHAEYLGALFRFQLRWLPYASFEWTKLLLGPEVIWHRLGNLALHLANGMMLFALLRRLFQVCLPTPEPLQHQSAHSDRFLWFALAGATIFLLHPAAVYGAAYLVQRTILMATLFSLLMWLLVLEGVMRNSWPLLLASAASYGLAVLSKEHAIMAPAVAAILIVLIKQIRRRDFRQLIPVFLLYGAIALYILYLARYQQVIGRAYEPRAMDMLQAFAQANPGFDPSLAYPLSILTQATLFFKYLLVWILPHPMWMSVDMVEPFATRLISWPHSIGFFCFILYFIAGVVLLLKRGHAGLLGFAMLAPWLLFAPELSTVRIQESFVLYRSYLWAPLIAACLPVVFHAVAPRRSAFLILALMIAMVPVTWSRLTTFSDELLLWNDAARLVSRDGKRPGVERIYLNRGISFYERGFHGEAIRDMDRALAIQPRYIEAFTTRGAAFLGRGELEQALQDFNAALRLNPSYFQPYLGRGRVHELRADLAEARRDYGIGCRLGSHVACKELQRITQ